MHPPFTYVAIRNSVCRITMAFAPEHRAAAHRRTVAPAPVDPHCRSVREIVQIAQALFFAGRMQCNNGRAGVWWHCADQPGRGHAHSRTGAC